MVLREAAGRRKAGIVHQMICDILIDITLLNKHVNIDNSARTVYYPVLAYSGRSGKAFALGIRALTTNSNTRV